MSVCSWDKNTNFVEHKHCEPSGHSRTGHTGHTTRLASKLARLANRLPGTNVPGWNFGQWPTPKFPDARPTLLIFRLIFPRLIFPRFSLAYRQRRTTQSYLSRRPLGYATWVESLVTSSGLSRNLFARSECDPLQLCFGARRRFLYAASLMPWSLTARGCSRTGKLKRSPARCPRKTSLWRSGTGFGRWGNWLFSVLVFCFYFLSAIHVFLVCVLPLAQFLTRCLQCRLSSKSLSCKERHHGWDGTLDLLGCCFRWVLWLVVSWLALLFLAGNSVIAWLFALMANSPSPPWP